MWNKLSMKEKAALIRVAVSNGLTDLDLIKNKYNEFAEGGDTNNNRPEDQPQITWIENWLNNRKDILAKNISMTKHGNSVPVYTPINNTGDVRNSRFDMDYNSTIYNPLYFLLGENPRIKQAEKIISREMQNIRNVPVTNVGDEYHPTSGVLGAYVEPSIWDNSGNYIAYLGTPTDDVKIHEFTHASQPKPQEYYIEDIIFKNKDIPNSVPGKTKANKSKEIYGALQQVRYKSGLLPNTIIDKKWLQENKKYIKNTYLENLSENDLLRLFNEVAQNSDNQLEVFNNPLEINNNFLALGGPLLNLNNPIESFNGGKRLPVVRYDEGGSIRNSKDKNRWLGTVFENYIIEAENPDSIGWDPKTKMWTTPNKKGYDKNQIGIGNDVRPKHNDLVQPYLIHNNDGTKSITEKNERKARYAFLDRTERSYEDRLHYANTTVNKGKDPIIPSDIKKAITFSAIYNQGPNKVANVHFEDRNLMNALIHGTDEEYLEEVLKYYNDKDRVRREREFFNNYKKSQEKKSIIDRLMSLFD